MKILNHVKYNSPLSISINFFLNSFLIIILVFFIFHKSYAEENQSQISGSDIPIPWTSEIPFPWDEAEGLWVALQNDETSSYYRFKVVRDNGVSGQQLGIEQIDKDTCRLLSTGVGHQSDKVIYGQVSDGTNHRSIRIYTFSAADYKFSPHYGKNISGSVIVLREMDLTDMHTVKAEYNMGKLEWGHAYLNHSNCENQKNQKFNGLDTM